MADVRKMMMTVAALLLLPAALAAQSTRSTGQDTSRIDEDRPSTRSTGQNTTRIDAEEPDGSETSVVAVSLTTGGDDPTCGRIHFRHQGGPQQEVKVCSEGEVVVDSGSLLSVSPLVASNWKPPGNGNGNPPDDSEWCTSADTDDGGTLSTSRLGSLVRITVTFSSFPGVVSIHTFGPNGEIIHPPYPWEELRAVGRPLSKTVTLACPADCCVSAGWMRTGGRSVQLKRRVP